jgi:hypothetical protein
VGVWVHGKALYFIISWVSQLILSLSIECMEQKYSKRIPRSYPFVEIGSTHLPLSRLLA